VPSGRAVQCENTVSKAKGMRRSITILERPHRFLRQGLPNDVLKQKSVEIFGQVIKDKTFQPLHRHCLAREFDIKGLVESKISWEYFKVASSITQEKSNRKEGAPRSAYGEERYEFEPEDRP
jgi:hypothetical protein